MKDEVRWLRADLTRLEISMGAFRDCVARESMDEAEMESISCMMRRIVTLYVDSKVEQATPMMKKGYYRYLGTRSARKGGCQ